MTEEASLDVRPLGPSDPLRQTAMRLVVSGQTVPDPETDRRVRELQDYVDELSLTLEPVIGAFADGSLIFAGAAVQTPGRAALVYLPPDRCARRYANEARLVLERLAAVAFERARVLVQALIPRNAEHTERALEKSGFRFLAELIYQERPAALSDQVGHKLPKLELVTYSAKTHRLFLQALEQTYQDSQDCPALTGIRSTDDVLDAHRATGQHDPELWFVATEGNRPVGVLLLSKVLRRRAIEVVYMGVSASARGRGVGDALLHVAVDQAHAHGADALTLAVDANNQPALRLYQRWRFHEIARRRAWLVTP